MAIPTGLTVDFGDAPLLSVDFVNRFGQRFDSLQRILGVHRMLPLANGSVFYTYADATVTLQVSPDKGDEIPLSEVVLGGRTANTIVWDKKRKAVALEDIHAYGFEVAIDRSDAAFIREIQKNIKASFYTGLATGTGVGAGDTLQAVLADNWAQATLAFPDDDVALVSFINPLDVGTYLETAQITIQNEFGLNYIKNFLGHETVILDGNIPENTIYTTVQDNLVLAYADMNAGAIATAGFDFATDETGLIGVTHDINKAALRAETITASGIVLYAERLDGVIVGTLTPAAAG